jgi:hypothetical protein
MKFFENCLAAAVLLSQPDFAQEFLETGFAKQRLINWIDLEGGPSTLALNITCS